MWKLVLGWWLTFAQAELPAYAEASAGRSSARTDTLYSAHSFCLPSFGGYFCSYFKYIIFKVGLSRTFLVLNIIQGIFLFRKDYFALKEKFPFRK